MKILIPVLSVALVSGFCRLAPRRKGVDFNTG